MHNLEFEFISDEIHLTIRMPGRIASKRYKSVENVISDLRRLNFPEDEIAELTPILKELADA